MGNRGPKAKPAERKDNPTCVRLPPDLRHQLEVAGEENRTTLSNEIIRRLEASFESNGGASGGGMTPAILDLFDRTLAKVRSVTGHSWHEHPYSFRLATEAVHAILDHYKPAGRPTVPNDHPALENARALNQADAATGDRRRPFDVQQLKRDLQDVDGGV